MEGLLDAAFPALSFFFSVFREITVNTANAFFSGLFTGKPYLPQAKE
jgi:hypothetical protein